MAQIGSLTIDLLMRTQDFTAGAKAAGMSVAAFKAKAVREINSISKEYKNLGKVVNQQTKWMRGWGAAIVAGGAALALRSIIKETASFEKGLVAVGKTINITGSGLKIIGKDI